MAFIVVTPYKAPVTNYTLGDGIRNIIPMMPVFVSVLGIHNNSSNISENCSPDTIGQLNISLSIRKHEIF